MPETSVVIDVIGETEPAKLFQDELATLGATALKGTFWSVGAYGLSMFLRLLSNIVLTRLLVPQYFGLLTLVITTITGLSLFSDLGVTPNIIRSRRGDEPTFLNTAWTMQVVRGVGLWICCLLLSWPLARFYREPSLGVLIPAIGFSLVLSGLNSTSLSTLARRMNVRELSLMELSIQIGQFVFTVAWAFFDRSVWALVGGRLFSDAARLIVSHRLLPGWRNSFRWEREAVRELLYFGRWVFFSTALMFLASQSDRLVLGKLVSLRTLGLYGIAFTFADIPRQIIVTFCGHIVVPFVAKIAHRPRSEFFGMVLKYRGRVLLAAAAILAIAITSGDLFVSHIYDARYHDAAWIVPILAIGLWHSLLYSTTNPCLFALGKLQYMVTGNFINAVVILSLVPLAFYKWGMAGAVWTVALADVPTYFVNLYGLRREGMSPVSQDLKATLTFLVIAGGLVLARLVAGFPFPRIVALH